MAGIKSRRPAPAVVERWIKAGFGQGDGPTYKPFMFVRDVPSIGTSSTVKSWTTGRNHHYLSRQELKVHLLAEYSPFILDIREQFALLPWDETQSIASKLHITHPRYPGTSTPTVLTTDLVLTMKRRDGTEHIAVSVKLTKDLNARTLEKLLIERYYWNRRGIKWMLATEQNIPDVRAENLRFFEMALNDDRVARSGIDPAEFSLQFESNHAPGLMFNEILKKTGQHFDVDVFTSHALLGTAVWKRASCIDIDAEPLSHRTPVILGSGQQSVVKSLWSLTVTG
jgi:hypothetical protein